jgi:hypothetical protein
MHPYTYICDEWTRKHGAKWLASRGVVIEFTCGRGDEDLCRKRPRMWEGEIPAYFRNNNMIVECEKEGYIVVKV